MRALGQAFARSERGAVAIIAAVSSVLVLGCAGLAVDVGLLFMESRRLQGVADLAAMSGARDLASYEQAIAATVADNIDGAEITITSELGGYSADASLDREERFDPTAASANAVRVELSREVSMVFAPVITGKKTMTIRRTATAASAQLAAFSIGSRLASVDGGVANAALGALTGGEVALTVMDYNALTSAEVDIFAFTDALRTSADLELASFDDVLEGQISVGDAFRGVGAALEDDGDVAGAEAMDQLADAAGEHKIRPEDLIDLGPYGAQSSVSSGAQARVSAMDLAWAIATLAGEGRQLKLDFGATIPGLVDLDVWLAVGERPASSPWLAITSNGSMIVRTAQMRLYAEASALQGLGLSGASLVSVPVYVELASAEAKLDTITCPADVAARQVRLQVRPSIGRLAIGDIDLQHLNNFKKTITVSDATFLDLILVDATGKAEVKLGGDSWQAVNFSASDIAGGMVKTVSTTDLASTALSDLAGDVDIDLHIVGLGIRLGGLTGALEPALATMGGSLDGVLNSLTALAGASLGEADVRVGGLRCRDAALVG